MRSRLLLVCLLLNVPFCTAEGQWLRSGQTVRVRFANGQGLEAQVAGIDSATGALRFADTNAVVPISSIDSMWVRRHATGRGALIGGAIVGGISAVFWTAECFALNEGEGGPCQYWGYVIVLTLAGGAGGALVGALIGSMFPRWEPVDPQRVTISLGAGDRGLTAGARIRFD